MRGCGFLKKRKGIVLMGIVLIMFLVFSILTVIAMGFAVQTIRVERWHVEYQEQLRLTYLARSAVNAIAEHLIKNDDAVAGESKTEITINISSIDVDLMISGDLGNNLIIQAVAKNDESKESKVSALFSTDKKKIVDWSENE